ncbi:MAG: dienelactone hydrolase family protein [Polyangiaceae bacterium]
MTRHTGNPRVALSKVVAHALRHDPERYGIELDRSGWVAVDDLIAGLRMASRRWRDLTPAALQEMAGASAKQRFELRAGRIRARIYVGWADEDGSFTPDNAATLEAALTAAGVHHQLERYPGARHGFAVPSSPSYDAAPAERHWQRLLSLYAEAGAAL